MTRNKMTRDKMTHNTMTWCTNRCRWLRLHRHRSGNPWRHRTPADRWRNDICRRGMAPDVSCGSRCLKCKENVRINQWKCWSSMEMSEFNGNVKVFQWKFQNSSMVENHMLGVCYECLWCMGTNRTNPYEQQINPDLAPNMAPIWHHMGHDLALNRTLIGY